MKKTAIISLLFLSLWVSRFAYAADDVVQVLGEVDQLQATLQEKTPESLKGLFARIDAWRVSQIDVFTAKRDAQDAILNPEGEEKTVTLNEEGNIEIETGLGEAKQNPTAAALFYLFLIVVFIFSVQVLFYAIGILLVLTILKILVGILMRKKE